VKFWMRNGSTWISSGAYCSCRMAKRAGSRFNFSAAALEVLTGLPRIEGSPHIIPGDKIGEPKADLKKP
jgi:hypothetical protein